MKDQNWWKAIYIMAFCGILIITISQNRIIKQQKNKFNNLDSVCCEGLAKKDSIIHKQDSIIRVWAGFHNLIQIAIDSNMAKIERKYPWTKPKTGQNQNQKQTKNK
jgi:hypothetical protein